MVANIETETTHLLEMMFSPLFGREDVFDLKLRDKGLSYPPLSLDLAVLQHDVQFSKSGNSSDRGDGCENNGFLFDLPFAEPHLSLIKDCIARFNLIMGKKRIRPEEIPCIPSSVSDISYMRQWIAAAFELHLDSFLGEVSRGVSVFLPNCINYQEDYNFSAYSTLKELQRGVERFATSMQRRRNLESLRIFSAQGNKNLNILDSINLALYTRPDGGIKDNPIDVIIVRIKDFYESLPQKIARYWVNLLRGYNDMKTVSGIHSKKKLMESEGNENALFIRSNGDIRQATLEDLLITDILGVAIILNDRWTSQKIEPADFYRGELCDARQIVHRSIKSHGFRRRISKLINPKSGVMLDYHTIPSLDDYITAEFSSERAHLIYAIRRHNSYLADKRYGKLYRAIYEAVKEIISEASVPSLQPNRLSYWRKSQQQDKALAVLSQETTNFCSSFGISDAVRIMIKEQYTVLKKIKPSTDLRKYVRRCYNDIPAHRKDGFHQNLHSLILNYVSLFEKTVESTQIIGLIDAVSTTNDRYRIGKHPLRIILELDFLITMHTASSKLATMAANNIEQIIASYSETIKSLNSLCERLYCIDKVAPFITFTAYKDVKPFFNMIQLYVPILLLKSANSFGEINNSSLAFF